MRLTYDKTHKTLSLIAVTVFLTVSLTAICSILSSTLIYLVNGYFGVGNVITTLVSLSSYLFYIGIVLALIWRKKNVLTGLAFGLPLVYVLLVQPALTYVIYPILQDYTQDVVDAVLGMLQDFVFSLPLILFYVAIMISCFTKGKLFGEKAGFVLLILGGFAYLTAVTRPVTGYFVSSVVTSIRYARELGVGELLRDFLQSGYINFSVLLTASPTLLIALAFFRPNQEPVAPEETEEALEEAEETQEVLQ